MRANRLVAALACLSVAAMAQQSGNTQQPSAKHEVKSPRDIATGQASGRKMNSKADDGVRQSGAQREDATGKATGKTMAQDDWHAQSKTVSGDPHVTNVSADSAESGQADAIRESPSKSPLGVRESPSKASLRESPSKSSLRESPTLPSKGQTSAVATGDLNGDGTPDKTASSSSGTQSPRDLATGQASGKRQHQPVKLSHEAGTGSSPKN